MTIIVLGSDGQVARELARRCADILCLGRNKADLRNPGLAVAEIRDSKPDAVINAAAYTAVDKAETEEELATQINAAAPGTVARFCAEFGVPFVHLSTDYVFDGTGKKPWLPDAPTAPLGAYGRSKLAGELAVRNVSGTHAILRTSWVFSAHGSNFVKTMLRLGAERTRLDIVADQVGGPTPAAAIAVAVLEIARQLRADPAKSGTYHFSGTPDASWAVFAREIFSLTGMSPNVQGIPSRAYPTPAPRPANSRLDCASLMDTFGISRPEWKPALRAVLDELR